MEHQKILKALDSMTLRELRVMRTLLNEMIERRAVAEIVDTYIQARPNATPQR